MKIMDETLECGARATVDYLIETCEYKVRVDYNGEFCEKKFRASYEPRFGPDVSDHAEYMKILEDFADELEVPV